MKLTKHMLGCLRAVEENGGAMDTKALEVGYSLIMIVDLTVDGYLKRTANGARRELTAKGREAIA